jgi:hypothetical protein
MEIRLTHPHTFRMFKPLLSLTSPAFPMKFPKGSWVFLCLSSSTQSSSPLLSISLKPFWQNHQLFLTRPWICPYLAGPLLYDWHHCPLSPLCSPRGCSPPVSTILTTSRSLERSSCPSPELSCFLELFLQCSLFSNNHAPFGESDESWRHSPQKNTLKTVKQILAYMSQDPLAPKASSFGLWGNQRHLVMPVPDQIPISISRFVYPSIYCQLPHRHPSSEC